MIRIISPWLYRKNFDLCFILLPAFLSVFAAFLFGDFFLQMGALPLWVWVVFVLGIDVSHVYSTLYKTYLHPEEYIKNKNLLIFIPLLLWVAGVMVHTVSGKLFWTLLAYVAVFHFIRQQYGFMRLYGQTEKTSKNQRLLDALVIYAGTIYPIIFWHAHPRDFNWFLEDDFLKGLPIVIEKIAWFLYLLIMGTYIVKEILLLKKGEALNLPKNLMILGTVLSWYVGIVLFNGDFTFTITNIVAHGIPYMALIWIWGSKNEMKILSRRLGIFSFLGILFLLAYVEEAFWAGFIWREHLDVFAFFKSIPAITNRRTLSLVVPLLTLPQATHYILDGFIWKVSRQARSLI